MEMQQSTYEWRNLFERCSESNFIFQYNYLTNIVKFRNTIFQKREKTETTRNKQTACLRAVHYAIVTYRLYIIVYVNIWTTSDTAGVPVGSHRI